MNPSDTPIKLTNIGANWLRRSWSTLKIDRPLFWWLRLRMCPCPPKDTPIKLTNIGANWLMWSWSTLKIDRTLLWWLLQYLHQAPMEMTPVEDLSLPLKEQIWWDIFHPIPGIKLPSWNVWVHRIVTLLLSEG